VYAKPVKRGALRTCDVCDEKIVPGTPFRSGWTTPESLADGDPTTQPSFQLEGDGTARVDLCQRCADESPQLADMTTEDVDLLH